MFHRFARSKKEKRNARFAFELRLKLEIRSGRWILDNKVERERECVKDSATNGKQIRSRVGRRRKKIGTEGKQCDLARSKD